MYLANLIEIYNKSKEFFIDKSPNVMGRNLKECKHGDRKDLGFLKLVQQKSSSGPRKKIYIEKTRLLPC